MGAFAAIVVRVESPPVQEKQGLFLCFQCAADLLDEQARQGPDPAVGVTLVFHVHDLDARKLPLLDAFCEGKVDEFFFARVVKALQPRGGRSQDDGRPLLLGPHHRQIPGIVGHPLILLVGRVVFLVDDDEPQIVHGRKDGRPGAHNDFRFAPFDFSPLVISHSRADPAVEDGDLLLQGNGSPGGW